MTAISCTANARTVRLADGHDMPRLGFGVFLIPPDETRAVVRSAIEMGYRSIDTAAIYNNERAVGEAVADSGMPREQLFVTSKLWFDDLGYDRALVAFDATMAKLGLDVLDLYLIHWPKPSLDRYVESWRALVRLRDEGRVKSIGVANFLPDYVDRLIAETGVAPVVNQIELHPEFQQRAVRAYHANRSIALESWSPLGRSRALAHPTVAHIAEKHGCSPAQLVLRWHLDQGLIVIPKASSRGHMLENLDPWSVDLDEEDLEALDALDRHDGRIGGDPATM